jgi:Mg-chelatase subunit ChlD
MAYPERKPTKGDVMTMRAIQSVIAVLAALTVAEVVSADGPKAGVYVGLHEAAGVGLTLTLSERPNGRFQVSGTAQAVDSGESRPVSGTYYPDGRGLKCFWRTKAADGSRMDLPIDGTWDPAANAFSVKLPVFAPFGPGKVDLTVKRGNQTRAIDLVFCIDGTSSMGEEMAAVRKSTERLMADLKSKCDDLRVRLVVFTDHTETQVIREWAFTTNTAELQRSIETVQVAGGGDTPEAVYTGLMTAINSQWRTGVQKLIVLIGDAPPNSSDPVKLGDVKRRALEVDPADIYPIAVANGGVIDPATLSSFQEIADGCRGQVLTTETAEELPEKIIEAVGRAIDGAPAGGNIGELVVCADIVDNQPVGEAAAFSGAGKLCAYLEYTGLPDNTELVVQWQSDVGQSATSRQNVGGNGSAWFCWTTTRAGGFPPGNYSVTVTKGGETLARREFTVTP